MARHAQRARLISANGLHIKYIPIREAVTLVREDVAVLRTSRKQLKRGMQLVIQLNELRRSQRVVATLTASDMEQNAIAVADCRKHSRARDKKEAWPTVHDTRAVTIVAGRGVFVPGAKHASA